MIWIDIDSKTLQRDIDEVSNYCGENKKENIVIVEKRDSDEELLTPIGNVSIGELEKEKDLKKFLNKIKEDYDTLSK